MSVSEKAVRGSEKGLSLAFNISEGRRGREIATPPEGTH